MALTISNGSRVRPCLIVARYARNRLGSEVVSFSRPLRRLGGWALGPRPIRMSSPIELAGQKPYTPLAVNSFSFTIRSSSVLASVNSFLASSPTTGLRRSWGTCP